MVYIMALELGPDMWVYWTGKRQNNRPQVVIHKHLAFPFHDATAANEAASTHPDMGEWKAIPYIKPMRAPKDG